MNVGNTSPTVFRKEILKVGYVSNRLSSIDPLPRAIEISLSVDSVVLGMY